MNLILWKLHAQKYKYAGICSHKLQAAISKGDFLNPLLGELAGEMGSGIGSFDSTPIGF